MRFGLTRIRQILIIAAMRDGEPTRASLLLRVRDTNDAPAWSEFMGRYAPVVLRHCRRRGLQDADAADVTQDVLRAVASAIKRFDYDPSRGAFRQWLCAVTRSKLNRYFRRRMSQESGSGRTTVAEALLQQPDGQEEQEWSDDCRAGILDWALRAAREKFTEKTWRAFYLTAVEGKSADDAAAQTGLSVGAVYVAKSRVVAQLRRLVESAENDGPEK
jgi:RNA polymerase sigma-70 factor (ECF subfamily)